MKVFLKNGIGIILGMRQIEEYCIVENLIKDKSCYADEEIL